SELKTNILLNWNTRRCSQPSCLQKEKTKPKIQLPEHLRIRPVTPVEKYIKVNPSPPVPKTSQGFIGWRSAVPELQLERCFQIQSCKGAFFKDLNWPREPSD
uniref:Chromosome 20 open reading frame 85 n=1 Tax=Pavo cristatus TaxID=9049 RepID=A0A8C9F7K1_PAVCR